MFFTSFVLYLSHALQPRALTRSFRLGSTVAIGSQIHGCASGLPLFKEQKRKTNTLVLRSFVSSSPSRPSVRSSASHAVRRRAACLHSGFGFFQRKNIRFLDVTRQTTTGVTMATTRLASSVAGCAGMSATRESRRGRRCAWRPSKRVSLRGSQRDATGGADAEGSPDAVPPPTRVRVFDPMKQRELALTGSREALVAELERRGGAPRDAVVEELVNETRALFEALEGRAPAKEAALRAKWRLVWSKQASDANPFQRLFQNVAENYQIFTKDAVFNVVQIGPVKIEAKAQSKTVSDVRTEIVIRTVDISFAGNLVKTIELQPRPGAGAGWVDHLYLDDEMRISLGNKGSLFVHVKADDDVTGAENTGDVTTPLATTTITTALAPRAEKD